MLYNKENIDNSGVLTLSSIKSDKFKTSVITFSMTIPLYKEAVAYNLILSGLLRRGTKKYPSMSALNRTLDELYGSYVEIRSAHLGDNLSLIFSAEVLDDKYIPDNTDVLGGVISVISDLILQPLIKDTSFKESVFLQEKKVIIDNIKAIKNNTRAYAVSRCKELLRAECSNYPTQEELTDIIEHTTFDEIVSYYDSLLEQAPLDTFYIGSADASLVKEKMSELISNYPRKVRPEVVELSSYRPTATAKTSEKMSVSQGKLALGFSTGINLSQNDDKYYVALMLNEIFGGSASSKLFLNVREKMSLCYYCSSSYSIYTGILLVSSGIEVSKRRVAENAILDQLHQIANGNISEQELETARRSITNSYRQIYDTPFDIQAFYSGRALFGVTDTIDICIEKLLSVSAKDIAELAAQITLNASFFVEGTGAEDDIEEDFDND